MKVSRLIADLILLLSILGSASALRAADPEGSWSGDWESRTNGHSGRICAHVHQKDCCSYRVTFSGTFLGVVPFAYMVPMTVVGQGPNGETKLYGEAYLPLFGKFHCRANVSDCCFVANYWSTKDQGQFVMSR